MDIAAIGSLLGSLKAATDIAKFIRESDVSLERAELKLKLAELVGAIADAKIDAANVQQAIGERDAEIRSLKAAAKLRSDVKWEAPCYYVDSPEGVPEPYCQRCYDGSGKLSRLHTDSKGLFECTVCRQTYKSEERTERDRAAIQSARAARRMQHTPWM